VVDTTPATLAAGTATGFSFTPYAVELFLDAIRRGLALYRSRDEPEGRWHQVVRTAMRQDWSWDRSAGEYVRLYERIAEERGQGSGVRGQQSEVSNRGAAVRNRMRAGPCRGQKQAASSERL